MGASRARQASETFNSLSVEERTAKLRMLRMFSSQSCKDQSHLPGRKRVLSLYASSSENKLQEFKLTSYCEKISG